MPELPLEEPEHGKQPEHQSSPKELWFVQHLAPGRTDTGHVPVKREQSVVLLAPWE